MSKQMTYRLKVFPPSGRGMTIVFLAVPPLQNFKGKSLCRGIKYTRVGKIVFFNQNLRLSWN